MASAADSIRYLYEDDLLRICGVARSTRKNWVKNQLLEERADGRYRERDVMETMVVAVLVRAVGGLGDVRRLREPEVAQILDALLPLGADDYLIGLLEPRLLRFILARSECELGAAMRPFEAAVAVPFLPAVAHARTTFWRFASSGKRSVDHRRRGRQSRRTDQSA